MLRTLSLLQRFRPLMQQNIRRNMNNNPTIKLLSKMNQNTIYSNFFTKKYTTHNSINFPYEINVQQNDNINNVSGKIVIESFNNSITNLEPIRFEDLKI